MSNQYKPQVSAYKEQLSNLQQEVNTFSTAHQGLIDEKGSLETAEENLKNTISNLRRQKNSLQEEVNILDRDLNTYQEKIGHLSLLVDADEGYDVFRSYGLSFHYPKGMTLHFEEIQDQPVSSDYGLIKGKIREQNKDENIVFTWQKVDFIPDIEGDVESMMSDFIPRMESEGYVFEKSEINIIKCDEHDLYHLNATATKNDEKVYVYYSGWFCGYRSLAYRIYYISSKPEIHDNYQKLVDNIQCHN